MVSATMKLDFFFFWTKVTKFHVPYWYLFRQDSELIAFGFVLPTYVKTKIKKIYLEGYIKAAMMFIAYFISKK